MAARGLTLEKHKQIHALLAEGKTYDQIVRIAKVAIGTVSHYSKRPVPPDMTPPDVATATLPKSVTQKFPTYEINTPGLWGVLSDLHLPYHDETTIDLAINTFRRRNAVGILLNGDVLDSHELSRHDKDPRAMRYQHEIEVGRQFIAYLRRRLPKARIVYKLGNHDERLDTYIVQRAPALFGLEAVNVESLLHLSEFGVEVVGEKRLIKLGKLGVLHGHEHKGGTGASPVNPARGAYLKCRSVVLIGHHHRPSYHPAKNVKGEVEAAWSTGCACDLAPRWLPFNDWLHGFAVVDVAQDGRFTVENKTILDGKVV
jgi:predicted phosphodiesterase